MTALTARILVGTVKRFSESLIGTKAETGFLIHGGATQRLLLVNRDCDGYRVMEAEMRNIVTKINTA